MSTVSIALIIIGSIAAIILVLVYISNNDQKNKKEKILSQFNHAGTESNMSFISQELLHDRIIGLDGLNKKLLILESNEDDYDHTIINLQDVKACNVKKIYQATNIGTSRKPVIEQHLEKVVLLFEFKDEKRKIEMPFFDFSKNHIYQLAEMEQKAKFWEASLSKFITSSVKKIA
ncbi:MAG: hypothetical protein ACJ748_13075 [Flavisolibacter sp.]